MKRIRYVVCLAVALSTNLSAMASATQSQSNNQSQTAEQYLPSFFAEYTPQTALDMVARLPGFVLIEADDDIRGFAAGAGNVLIDGARPTTKSGGIAEALRRIPSKGVAVIEILRGAGGNADAAGQSVVANVKRHQVDSGQEGGNKHWQLGLESDEDGKLSPSTEFTSSARFGEWATALNLNAKRARNTRQARTLSYSADQQLSGSQLEERPITLNETFVSADANRRLDDSQTLKVNGRLGWSQYIPQTQRDNYLERLPESSNSPDSHFSNHRDSQYYTAELGIDWQNRFDNDWQWRVRNLNNNKNWFVSAQSRHELPGENFDKGSFLRFDEHKSENILRSTLSYNSNALNQHQWFLVRQEYGAEVAYSRMDSRQKLHGTDADNQPIELKQNSHAKVAEKRSEMFANLAWQYQQLTVETGLGAEHSQITVNGDSEAVQSLFFIKPSLALTYDHSDDSQYRFSLRRSVGQLDFSDFAASSDLVNDRAFSGNAQLRPDTQLQAALAFDHRFDGKGALAVELYQQWRSDVLEQIQLPSGEHGLGNAGDATVQGVKLTTNLPLDAWLNQGLLSVKADFTRSEFDDPITGQSRELSRLSSPNITIDLRQDLIEHQLSWGIGYQSHNSNEVYYVNEYNHFDNEGQWNAFIESYALGDFKLRLSARNIGNERQRWIRDVYQGNRAASLQQRHDTHRDRGPLVSLTLSRNF